jgi:hypothetical protein
MNRNLAGRCGMYCGICEIHRGFKDAGKLRIDVAQKHGCLPGDIRCDGCRAVHVVGWSRDPDWGKNCRVLRCLKSQKLETCGDCGERSGCDLWGKLAASCEALGVDIKAGLTAMNKTGIEAWLGTQEERWRCQQCGHPIAVSSLDVCCHRCGSFQL